MRIEKTFHGRLARRTFTQRLLKRAGRLIGRWMGAEFSLRSLIPVGALLAMAAVIPLAGCGHQAPPVAEKPRWSTLPYADVPDFMHATLFERVQFRNTQVMPVYGYSLLVNLHGTGDSTAPTWVRDYIIKQMLLRGFDSYENPKYKSTTPQEMLSDKSVAIVAVEGELPVGVKEGQRFDVRVRTLPRNRTTSLAHGTLYQTVLNDHGFQDPTGINARTLAYVPGGEVFVNPAYAMNDSTSAAARGSLTTAKILSGGIAKYSRPIDLRLREPQLSTARLIERLIARRYNTPTPDDISNTDRSQVLAWAEDEGLVQIYVPDEYRGDWKHYLGVVSHMFLDDSPGFLIIKAKQMVELAHRPKAPLVDISLCWEAMGEEALPIYEPLISDPDPRVAYAAARAAAFCDDAAARQALLRMATDSTNPQQLEAVETIGALPTSPETTHMLRTLLDSDRADVRIAAYRILADSGEAIYSHKIGDRFFLDVVESSGPPMIYATNTGIPRLAIFGHNLTLQTPITFTTMQMRFSVSSSDSTDLLDLFYRDPRLRTPVDVMSHNDLVEILRGSAGKALLDEPAFDFSFNDVVAIAQQLVAQKCVYQTDAATGKSVACLFELEHPRPGDDEWTSLPTDNLNGRPQGGGGPTLSPSTQPSQPPVSASAGTGSTATGATAGASE